VLTWRFADNARSVGMSEARDEKKTDREARKAEAKRVREEARAETKRAKEEARAKKQAELEAARKLELERYGAEVARAIFGNKTITIRQRGYVSVGGMFSASSNYERLISIDASGDVSKKSGVGRGVGAVMTMGLNLAGSNKRGDVYLTIVTDSQTYVLREDPPTASNMKSSKQLEAAGNAVLQTLAASKSQEPAAGTPDVRERLSVLSDLLADGLITQEEFDRKRTALLDEL
jgi:hypothetical protein